MDKRILRGSLTLAYRLGYDQRTKTGRDFGPITYSDQDAWLYRNGVEDAAKDAEEN